MQFLLHILSFIIGSYIAFSGSVASMVSLQQPVSMQQQGLSARTSDTSHIVQLKSSSRQPIPDILLRNPAYQQASIIDSINPSEAPATALEALVNIYCSYSTKDYTKTITGTGFFIDTNGIILTNAHVAQFLLLEGIVGKANCIIRTGNPAAAAYTAELLYISPAWIQEHADLINDIAPKGTGERDYALLYVTAALDDKPMPAQFPALPFDVTQLTEGALGSPVFATGYPAETMLAEGVNAPLLPKQATTTVAQLLTFATSTVDLFTIRGTAIGEHGSSGGPVVDAQGKAIGIISTKGDDEQFGTGSLRAISIPYIDRTIKEETGFTLFQNLGGNLPYRAELFKKTIVPLLQNTLKQQIWTAIHR